MPAGRGEPPLKIDPVNGKIALVDRISALIAVRFDEVRQIIGSRAPLVAVVIQD